MNDLLKPPAERDLPPARAARIRADLLTAARGPLPRVPRRLLVAAAAVLTLIATVAVTLEVRRADRTPILAMSPGELDPSLRRAAQRCLEWADPRPEQGAPEPAFVPMLMADVAIASRRGSWIQVLFLSGAGYLGCEMRLERGQLSSGSVGGEAWPHRGWLPGPVQRLSLFPHCYTDPAGKVIYGDPGPDCRPADPWTR